MAELEGRDIFADDFIRQEQLNSELESPSEIQRFFEGTTILITGGTGFFGKILIEKLLRVCWKLNKIYLLMRPKKGKTVEERFEEQFDEAVSVHVFQLLPKELELFDTLKKCRGRFKDKVMIIEGDLAEDKNIISDASRQLLIETVDIVFHCAATVRFDERLRRAVTINIKSTKYLLDMAHEMKRLKAFVHVSTAYSNCPEREIKEQFYPPPYDYRKITGILEVLDDNILDKITPDLIQKYPNTYAFTKMIAESVVKEFGKGLPIGIVRPSIVISTYKEPLCGWINNYYGPQGVVFGAGLGLLRTLHCDPKVVADMVPVDFVINAIVALAWDLGQTKGDNPNFEKLSWKETLDNNSNVDKNESTDEIPILNQVSSVRNPITWENFMALNYDFGKNKYSDAQLWYSSITLNSNYYMDRAERLVCHFLPAIVVDLIAVLIGKKPMLWNAYKKIHKFSEVISYFCTNEWKFHEDNTIKLWNKLPPKDKILFNFNIEDLVWEEYFQYYLKGMAMYLVRDSLAALKTGKYRALRLRIYHYLVVTIVNVIFFYTLYRIFCFIFT